MEEKTKISTNLEEIRRLFETFVNLYYNEFIIGLDKRYVDSVFLSKEILHCAVVAYYDDINKYIAYSGAEYADQHKQAAYTMMWISRFKPIQIKEDVVVDSKLLAINAAFAIFAGLAFLDASIMNGMTERFYKHLVYTLTYRNLEGRGLCTLMYLIETLSKNNVKF